MTDIESLVALGEGITPGPWDSTATVSFHDRPDLPCVVDEYRLVVAQCWDDGHSEDECEANARAIAAVPDLIAAIRTLQTEKVELREALAGITEIAGETLDKDFGVWSSPSMAGRRGKMFNQWKNARQSLSNTGEME